MRLQFEQTIPLPQQSVFAFHENPKHTLLVYGGRSRLRLLHHGGRVRRGGRLWVEATVAGILPVVMGFEHVIFDPPHRFGEELIHGPFRRFIHIHEFEPVETGTLVRDRLDVELPRCYGGEPATELALAPMIRRTFHARNAALLSLARSGAIAESAGEPQY